MRIAGGRKAAAAAAAVTTTAGDHRIDKVSCPCVDSHIGYQVTGWGGLDCLVDAHGG